MRKEQPTLMQMHRRAEGIRGLKPVKCSRCNTPYSFRSKESWITDGYHVRCNKCGHQDVVVTTPIE